MLGHGGQKRARLPLPRGRCPPATAPDLPPLMAPPTPGQALSRTLSRTLSQTQDQPSFKQQLESLVREASLAPASYSSMSYTDKTGKWVTFAARVLVNGEGFNSHPANCSSADSAEEEAARKAFLALMDKKGRFPFRAFLAFLASSPLPFSRSLRSPPLLNLFSEAFAKSN